MSTTHRSDTPLNTALDAVKAGTLPTLGQEIDFEVQAALAAGDLPKIYNTLAARMAPLPIAQVEGLKAKIRLKFSKDFKERRFDQIIKEARAATRRATRQPANTILPEIKVNNRPMRDMAADSIQALRAANDPPVLFIRSGEMVYLGADERKRPSIVAVSRAALRGRMDRAANYIRCGAETDIVVPPPLDVVDDILALPSADWGLPPLEVVVEIPTLRPDGTVLDQPGYDAPSHMIYQPAPGLSMDPLPDQPDAEDLDAAISLLDDATGEFPYADDASRANLFGLLLTPIIRPAITGCGCTPLALIDAPQAGTGKSLLVDVFSMITTGRPAAMTPYPRTEEEIQKSIGSILLAGRSIVCFDNFEGELRSPTLALVLTAKQYAARILGMTEDMVVPNRATWIVTGNNIRPSGDMPRRCYHIRLDAKLSRPYQGRKFKHENLLAWVEKNRGALLRALLIIARAWFCREKPCAAPDPLASFEDWHSIVAGALHVARVRGFLCNLGPLLETDETAIEWNRLLVQLQSEYPGGTWFEASAIAEAVRSDMNNHPHESQLYKCPFTLPGSLANIDRKKKGLAPAIGRAFGKHLNTRFGEKGLFLARHFDDHTGVSSWRVMDSALEQMQEVRENKPA